MRISDWSSDVCSSDLVERRITVVAREDVGEIAPGTTQELWNFDGVVPGPVYRGRIGDRFRFALRNDGRVGHSIDFHASKVAWNDKMRTIQPGEKRGRASCRERACQYV